jgi:Na+-driven multidrug efflux pump
VLKAAAPAAITTLGSKYLGERNAALYQRMAIVLIALSLALGLCIGGATLFFADDLLNLFTNEADVKAIIKPVLPVFVPYMSISMVSSVMGGMGWAMQEFGWMAVISVVGTLTYVPMAVYVKAEGEVSLLNLMRVSLYNQCITATLMAALCLWLIPRRLRAMAAADETERRRRKSIGAMQ